MSHAEPCFLGAVWRLWIHGCKHVCQVNIWWGCTCQLEHREACRILWLSSHRAHTNQSQEPGPFLQNLSLKTNVFFPELSVLQLNLLVLSTSHIGMQSSAWGQGHSLHCWWCLTYGVAGHGTQFRWQDQPLTEEVQIRSMRPLYELFLFMNIWDTRPSMRRHWDACGTGWKI